MSVKQEGDCLWGMALISFRHNPICNMSVQSARDEQRVPSAPLTASVGLEPDLVTLAAAVTLPVLPYCNQRINQALCPLDMMER